MYVIVVVFWWHTLGMCILMYVYVFACVCAAFGIAIAPIRIVSHVLVCFANFSFVIVVAAAAIKMC